MNSILLKEYIALIVEQKVKPEAPKGSPFGQYLWARDRKDGVPPEKDTKFELEFYNALSHHYGGNSKYLAQIAPKIIKLKNADLYSKILTPPNKKVYRILRFTTKEETAKFLPPPLAKDKLTMFSAPAMQGK